MEPISASCYNVNDETLAERQTNEKFLAILGSVASITKYEERSFKTLLPQISAAIFATSFHVVLGISLAFSAILIPQLEKNPEFPMTKSEASWIVSVIALTTPIGTIISGFLMDKYGRLNTLRLAAVPSVIGWVAIALSRNVPTLIAGRIFTSFASALGSGPAVVYITEIARVDMRGSLICFGPALASLGMMLTFLEGWFLDWRQVAWSCLIYTLAPLGLIYFLPESAAWLVARNRNEEAKKTLIWMNRHQPQPGDKSGTFADLQLALMQKEHELKLIRESKRSGSALGGFLKPTGYKPLLILSGLFCFQQFSGIFIFLFNSISFFQEIGTTFDPYAASIFIGVIRFIMSMASSYVLTHFQRRPLVMVSFAGMTVSILVSALFTHWIKQGTTTMTWVPAVFMLLFVFTSMMGVIPIPFTMTAELFPLEIRGVAHSVSLGMANIFMFVSLQSYPYLLKIFEGMAGLQCYFGVVTLIGIVFAFIFLPETHNTKLKDIEEYFNHNVIYLGQKTDVEQQNVGKEETLLQNA